MQQTCQIGYLPLLRLGIVAPLFGANAAQMHGANTQV